MTMTMLTALQLVGITIAYFISTLVLPWLLLRRRFEKLSFPVRFMGYFVAGNFYIINLVLLLQLVHLSYRATLIIGTLIPFGAVFYSKNRGHISGIFGNIVNSFRRILERDLTIKTICGKRFRERREKRSSDSFNKKKMFSILEGVLVAAVVAIVVYIYGYNIFEGYSYQASDVLVHNAWINEMSKNNVFSNGVYPFGFHCIIYYLHAVFGIKTMTLLRLFCVVQTVMIHLMLLAFMRAVCKSRYMPYLTVAVYVLFDFFGKGTYTRFGATLPQEYGMIFILPSICFLIEFFRRFRPEQEEAVQTVEVKETDPAAKRKIRFGKWRRRPLSDWYLVLFAMSISLTLAIHFYNTMIAGLFCIGIAVGFITRLVRWKYLKRVLVAGISGLMIAVIPMVIGYAEEKGLNGSLYWGLSVVSGEESDDVETEEDVIKNSEEIQMYDENGELTIKEKINKSLFSKCAYVIARDLINVDLYLVDEELELYDIDAELVTGKLLIFFAPAMIMLGLLGCFIQKKKDCLTQEYCMTIISVGVYIALLFALLCSLCLGLPELMDKSRTTVFLAYSLMAAAGLFLDAVISYAFCMCKNTRFSDIASVSVSAAVICVAVLNDMIKPTHEMNEEYGLREAVLCTENILHDNKGKDYTWTIVSANDENRMIEEYGRHYETITFLRDMREIEKDPEVTLPTETVYFYIEKQTVNYSDKATYSMGGYVSEDGAAEPIYGSSTLGAYQGTDRWITMSHMYYWAQEFMKLYPNEMEIYYETDRFICYRIQQNPYSLYNFAIDYGYNDPKATEMTDEE